MPVNFSDDELFLIEQLAKTPEEFKKLEQKDLDRVAALLVKHMGDMKFNKKLCSLQKSPPPLAKFIYKTQDYEAIESISRKIQINKQLTESHLEIAEEEKLSLKEMGKLIKLSDFSTENYYSDFNRALKYISKHSTNQTFKELYQNITLSHSAVSNIQQKIVVSKAYKTNDISVENINKSRATHHNKVGLFDYDGPLAQILLSDGYGHAAPLYTAEAQSRTKVKQSHIIRKYENTEAEITDIITADTFRIDPCKLINKSLTINLEKLYGKKWQENIRSKYQDISYSLHNNLELKTKEIKNKKIEIERTKKTLKTTKKTLETTNSSLTLLQNNIQPNQLIQKKLLNAQNQIVRLEKKINNLTSAIEKATEEKKNLSKTQIKNDLDRVNDIDKWFSPKAIIQGHTKLGHKNDFRKLSNEMFNPTEVNKKMICSEFGAVTIAASIDQLNRIVALDLQAAGLIDKEQEIFKNPIPKNERIDKIHPGRLVHLLKKAGAVEVHNETVDQYVKRNDLTSMKTANIELDLPNKILFLLKNSESEQDFLEKANKNLAIYLEAYKVEQEVIQQIKKDSEKQFKDFYKRKNETGILTSIKKFCKGIAVSLHLREKEKSTKKLSSEILTQVEKIQKQRAHQQNANKNFYSSMVAPKTTSASATEKLKKENKTSRSR